MQDLYQEMILEHGRHPRNFHALDPCEAEAEAFNPLCGDEVHLYLRGADSLELAFLGESCAIAKASASLMTERIRGLNKAEARVVAETFIGLLTGALEDSPERRAHLLKLSALLGVRRLPMRVKCASMCWHALLEALEGLPS